jgi:hypothetical protein
VTTEHLPIGKGLLRVTARPLPRPPVDASDVVLTILTGGRPAYLAETLDSTNRVAPGLLATARVIVLRQGTDPETDEVLWRWAHLFDQVHLQSQVSPIGEATSRLAAMAAGAGRPWWLHLEDDWQAITAAGGWLDQAKAVLTYHLDVGQVRMRHGGDPTRDRHLLTGRPIEWVRQANGHLLAEEAHWTFNPSLMRVADIPRVYPCDGEADAIRRAHTAGLRRTAQLHPGVWTHIGGASLRAKTRCRL